MAGSSRRLSPERADEVLALPLFEGLPPPSRKLLAKFGRLSEIQAGTELVQQGEFTSDFHVVLHGLVTGYRRESDGSNRRLVELAGGDWFGELSALSNQPSPAQFVADARCVLLTLEAGLFKDLYKAGRKFRARVDERYRERSLGIHLAVIPALRDLDRAQLNRLRRASEFLRAPEGEVIAAAGNPMDTLYLVRSGALVRETGSAAGEGSVDGYLMVNSSFGEDALWDTSARWGSTFSARTDSELVAIPVAAIRETFEGEPDVLVSIARGAEAATRADRSDAEDLHQDEIHGMVHRGSVKGGEALVIDLESCVRCNACVESCVAVHPDGIPRLSKSGFRVAPEANRLGKSIALVTSCYHCQDPGCMKACSYGAIRRDPQGLIRIVSDNCVGCAMCVAGCPYDVIRLTDPAESEVSGTGLLGSIPLVGQFLGGGKSEQKARGDGFHKEADVQGKAVKCDRCEGLPFEACVYNCPCGAIKRRSPSELFESGSLPGQVDH